MFQATNSSTPASTASGMCCASGAAIRTTAASVPACTMPATGDTAPARMFVTVRAMVPVAGMPPKNGTAKFATPCAMSSWFGSCLGVSLSWSATRAQSSDSIAPSSAMVSVGVTKSFTVCQLKSGSFERGHALRDAAEAGADGLDRHLQQPGQQRQRHQRHHRCRQPRCGLECADGVDLFQLTSELRVHRPQSRPDEQAHHAQRTQQAGVGVEAAQVLGDGGDLAEEVARHLGDVQPEPVAHLRQRDQHRDAVGEADHHADRHVTHQGAQAEEAQQEQQHAGAGGGDQQVGHAVALDDARRR